MQRADVTVFDMVLLSPLDATRVTVHTHSPKQGNNYVTHVRLQILPTGDSASREEQQPSAPNNQSSPPPLRLLLCTGLEPSGNTLQLSETVTSRAAPCRCRPVVGGDKQESDRGCSDRTGVLFFLLHLYITAEGRVNSCTSVLVARKQDMNNGWISRPHSAGLPRQLRPE
ncbi:Hypothetical predicted protein [Xyrichtys novacula]|uniref:Uncharacterized protein n=1 Tax=Xyrichtys novacula TaxID=13765 RepID=A0AAV1FQ49_XYRNO|nr:Hypothetical predicted protein [Xyrichtys novacula]